jgi:hypothetical protein
MVGMRRSCAALALALLIAAAVAGCGGGSVSTADQGCSQTILDVEGRIEPGSSGLSCDGVKEVLGGSVPAEPGGYLIQTTEPRATWKCHLYPSSGNSKDLLTCADGGRAFAIRRVK